MMILPASNPFCFASFFDCRFDGGSCLVFPRRFGSLYPSFFGSDDAENFALFDFPSAVLL